MANEFVAIFQLAETFIKKSDYQILDMLAAEEVVDNILNSMNINYEILGIDKREGNFIGLLELDVNIKLKKDKKVVLKFNLSITGLFRSPTNEMTEEQFKQMLAINGITSLYSICRAHIISVSSLCNPFIQIRLPMINVINFIKANKANQN